MFSTGGLELTDQYWTFCSGGGLYRGGQEDCGRVPSRAPAGGVQVPPHRVPPG